MNQNTCKTCKWWQWDNDTEYMAAFGQVKMKYGQPRIQFKCGGMDKMSAINGMVDGEHYDGVFTGPDFGCIHYEETQEQLPLDHPGYAAQQGMPQEICPACKNPLRIPGQGSVLTWDEQDVCWHTDCFDRRFANT